VERAKEAVIPKTVARYTGFNVFLKQSWGLRPRLYALACFAGLVTAGLGCDGDTIAITAATQPSIEEIVMGAIPGIPKVG